jgi:hypothetical protein
MLDADVDALLDVPVANDFVHDHADRMRRDVVDNARPAWGNGLTLVCACGAKRVRTHGSIYGACPFAGPRWP